MEYRKPVLTPRQKEVVWLLGQGYTHDEVGRELGGLSRHTIRRHLANIADKFGFEHVVAAQIIFEATTQGHVTAERPVRVPIMRSGLRAHRFPRNIEPVRKVS